MQRKEFRGSTWFFFKLSVLMFAGIISARWGDGIPREPLLYLLLGAWLSILLLSTLYIRIIIRDSRFLINKYSFIFNDNREIDLFALTRIRRIQSFHVLKYWGSAIALCSESNGEEVRVMLIHETNYTVPTIKAILQEILSINPNIQIDTQYKDLLDGKIEDEWNFKHKPAQRNTR